MKNAAFMYDNLWDEGTLTYSSQDSQFLATNTQHRWHTFPWRSRYGANSGWGNFTIESSVNDRIDFEDNGTTTRAASLTPGSYTADTLAAHIETQMEAVTSDTFTVEYDDTTNKFIITDDTGNFELLWNSGSNKSRSAADTLGYDDSADDTGSDSYTADDIRIHTEEWLKLDSGSAQGIKCFAFKFHNLSSTGSASIQLNASDSWSSPSVDYSLSISSGIVIVFWESEQSYRWSRLKIVDVDNSDGYVEVGRCYLGTFFDTSVNFRRDYVRNLNDPSDVMFSDGGQISSNKKTKFDSYTLTFEYINDTDIENFISLWEVVGITKDFFFTRDRDNASDTSHYVRLLNNLRIEHIVRDELFVLTIDLEELR